MLSGSQPSSRAVFNQHRVLIYATCYNVLDGVTLTIRKLEQEILAAGHDVCILTTVSGDRANTHLDGEHPNRRVIFLDNAIPIPFCHDPNNPELTYQIGFGLSSSVRRKLAAFEPSIIHITCPDSTALHLIQYARSKEIPLMGTYHSNIPDYMEHYPGLSWLKHILGAFFRHQYNFLQALYVPTPFIRKHLVDSYRMDRATKLGVWGRGVDVEKFNPAHRSFKYRHSLGIADDEVVLCWVGRLVPEKRPDIFASVVRRLAARNLRFRALVVGAGPCEEEIKALPKTIFAGWMNADQLAVAYASSDIFLFPSSVETFGNVTLEAAASGLPVIVEKGCSGHLVKTGENGFACAAGDEDAFYKATLQLVLNEKMRSQYSRNGRILSLSLEKRTVVRKMLDNYTRVTNEFFTEYGGHHFNRDVVYRKPGSFYGGTHPRPFLLVMFEYVFIVLFQVIWNMTNMFIYMQEAVLPAPPAWRNTSVTDVRSGSVSVAPAVNSTSSTLRRRNDQANPQQGPMTKPASFDAAIDAVPNRLLPLQDNTEGDPVHCDGDGELADVAVDSEVDENEDYETDSTVSTSDDEAASSVTSSPSSSSWCFSKQGQSFGDCQLSHILAKGFIDSLMFQMRMESIVRNACSASCCRNGTLVRRAKRKKSSWDISSREDIQELAAVRGRSDALEKVVPGADEVSSQRPHRLRRNQLSLEVA